MIEHRRAPHTRDVVRQFVGSRKASVR